MVNKKQIQQMSTLIEDDIKYSKKKTFHFLGKTCSWEVNWLKYLLIIPLEACLKSWAMGTCTV